MPDPWPQMRVSPGARADARLPAALDPIALRVRPATLAEDFAAAGRRLGAEVPPLARLFLDEPAYLLAEILAFRPEDAEQAFDIALDKAPETAPALVRALALRLGDWVARIKARLPGLSDARPARVMQAVLTGAPGADRAAATPADPLARLHLATARLRSTHALLRNAVASLQPAAARTFEARLASAGSTRRWASCWPN
ncbi:hypothetical protein [Rhodovulum marinum]|uniref:Uncharacterized protein n=1 Tax=Rhodovulum marinum TaxID=320662 RepID=A0A4V2SQT0_9RHOB|nr:hypothetical protein [Rhodovulum marinum]TCP40186.1 hypothetical protein EV662_10860 [Rhodovulum marinum]